MKTKKIKVNNRQELITKAKEYKNSVGNWKLRERYIEMPSNSSKFGGKRKKRLGWGIVISNGKQTIDIFSPQNNVNYKDLVEKKLVLMDEFDARPELWQLFPEAKFALFNNGNEKLNTATKELKKDNEDYALYRYLVAENSWHLKQMLHEYARNNENKIYQSANPHFSGWVEIVDGQDGNVYLYVGEKNESGGREIKIGITKNEFEKVKGAKYDNPYKSLENHWRLFTINRPLTPAETRKYYSSSGGLEKNWQNLQKFWEKTCRWTLEDIRRRMNDKLEFLNKEPSSEFCDREKQATHQKIEKIEQRLADMKKNHPEQYFNYDKECPKCGNKMCCHHESRCAKGKNCKHLWWLENQLSDSDKQKLFQYFLKNNIKKITLDNNNQIVIEYNDGKKEIKELSDSELKLYEDIIQFFPGSSLSLNELQNNVNHNNSTNKHKLLLICGIVLIMLVYLFAKRKKRK